MNESPLSGNDLNGISLASRGREGGGCCGTEQHGIGKAMKAIAHTMISSSV